MLVAKNCQSIQKHINEPESKWQKNNTTNKNASSRDKLPVLDHFRVFDIRYVILNSIYKIRTSLR